MTPDAGTPLDGHGHDRRPSVRQRGPRSDAARNADKLLRAARSLVQEHGPEVSLDAIARRAGVGNATLYRHFPTRADLVDAVFRDSLTGTMDAGERARKAPDAWAGLTGYLEVVFGALAAD